MDTAPSVGNSTKKITQIPWIPAYKATSEGSGKTPPTIEVNNISNIFTIYQGFPGSPGLVCTLINEKEIEQLIKNHEFEDMKYT